MTNELADINLNRFHIHSYSRYYRFIDESALRLCIFFTSDVNEMQVVSSLASGRAAVGSSRPHARPRTLPAPALRGLTAIRAPALRRRQHSSMQVRAAAGGVPSELLGVAAFFAPGAAILLYALVKGKGNLKDGLSRLLTEVSQGYFQPDVGGKTIPVAEGELSDLAGDEPLFKALYKWWVGGGQSWGQSGVEQRRHVVWFLLAVQMVQRSRSICRAHIACGS